MAAVLPDHVQHYVDSNNWGKSLRCKQIGGGDVTGIETSALLGSFLAEHEERIIRRAIKDLKYELEVGISRQQRKDSIPAYTGVLASLLLERGEEAPWLWSEEVRHYGGVAFENRRDVGDLVREFGVLQRVVLGEWEKRVGHMPDEIMELFSDCIVEGIAAAVTDYVRHSRGEQVEFRESALVHTLLDHLDEGIMLAEADGTFSLATRPALEMLGETMRTALGRSFRDSSMASILQDLQAQTLENAAISSADLPVFKSWRTASSCEPLLVRVFPDGKERILEFGSIVIWEGEASKRSRENLRGVIGTVRDRTVEIQNTLELRKANSELAVLQSRLLHRSRAQAMGELASGITHALNNILNAMHLRLRLLRENPGPEQMEAFEKEVEGTAKIVAWLQQFASQRSAGPIEVVELEEIAREALALVRPEAVRVGEGTVRLKYQGMGVGRVYANAIELRELLVSLLLYVRDQLAAGGKLEIITNQDEKHVICMMEFQADVGGPSRPEEWLAPVAQEGMAPLALAAMTARELLERWGGKLATRSLETGEAEFVLYFQPAQQVPIESPTAIQRVKKEGRKILVVDDDPDNAMMLAEVLFAEGHQAQTAESGKEALEKWKSEIFDVALIDLLMPDISGLDLANLLFRENRNARIALVTGWDLDEKQKGEALVHAVFRKPVNLDELFSFLGPLNELVSEEPSPSSME